MNQKQTKVSSLLQYYDKYYQCHTIVPMIIIMSKPLDRNESFEFESVNETAKEKVNLQLFMQERLAKATDPSDKEINSKISSKSGTTKGVASL
jgi:hypothetical protein